MHVPCTGSNRPLFDDVIEDETGTGNIDTIGGCCFTGAGGCFGPTTAVTLTSDPDKALANSEAAEFGGFLDLVGLRYSRSEFLSDDFCVVSSDFFVTFGLIEATFLTSEGAIVG